ncbi:MAG TPA: molybdenum cofactor guanylyltransferase [Thermoanaerobaculia bacterium]|nr:molybdenum cofactor guanylyltransferase [Thermoanaerobaculia bacterium]
MNCYILTGGRSTRMGRSKAALFLADVAKAAVPVFDRVIAVERHGAQATEIETIFEELHADEAPVFGVVRALQHARARSFVLATDYPLITTALLRRLRDAFEETTAPVLMPVWEGAPQPLCAGYAPELLPLLERRIAEGKLALRDLGGETIEITGNDLFNVNTAAELAEAEKLR